MESKTSPAICAGLVKIKWGEKRESLETEQNVVDECHIGRSDVSIGILVSVNNLAAVVVEQVVVECGYVGAGHVAVAIYVAINSC